MTDGAIISFYGDSTTGGTTWSAERGYYQTPNTEPALLQKELPGTVVHNLGYAGATCFSLRDSAVGDTRTWADEMAATSASIVTINVALNDAFHESPNDYAACLTGLIQTAKAAGKTVVVETPNPTTFSTETVAIFAGIAKQVALANGAHVIDQWTDITQGMPDWKGHLPDGIHPDDTMYQFKADDAAAVLAPLVPGVVPDGYTLAPIGNFRCAFQNNILIRDATTGDVARLETDNGMTFRDVGTAPASWQILGTADVDHNWTTDILFRDPASGCVSAFEMGYDGQATWAAIGWQP